MWGVRIDDIRWVIISSFRGGREQSKHTNTNARPLRMEINISALCGVIIYSTVLLRSFNDAAVIKLLNDEYRALGRKNRSCIAVNVIFNRQIIVEGSPLLRPSTDGEWTNRGDSDGIHSSLLFSFSLLHAVNKNQASLYPHYNDYYPVSTFQRQAAATESSSLTIRITSATAAASPAATQHRQTTKKVRR